MGGATRIAGLEDWKLARRRIGGLGFGGLEDWWMGALEDWRTARLEDGSIGGLEHLRIEEIWRIVGGEERREDWRVRRLESWRIGDWRIGGLDD